MTSSGRIANSQAGRLAEWTGRLLLLGAVAFWWGTVVVPRLVSLIFPDLLPPDAIPESLNPDLEGSVANAISAAALLIAGILAFANVFQPFDKLNSVRQAHGWIIVGGWTALAVTAVYLAWEEVWGFHDVGTRSLGERVLGTAYSSNFWPVLASPLILAFVLAMAVFVHKGLPSTSSGRAVRGPLVLGLAAWLLAIVHEAMAPFVYRGYVVGVVEFLEETLEFGGTLLIGLSAGIGLRGLEPLSGLFGSRRRFKATVWSIVVISCMAAVGVIAPSLGRAPLADARARAHVGTFHVSLNDSLVEEHSVVQELGVLPAPPVRLDLRVANLDPQGRSGTLIWRVLESVDGDLGGILREGRMDVAGRAYLSWERIDFAPLVEAEGRPLALQLVADIEPEAHLRIGATKTNRYQDGRLWINGALAWPDQNIEFVAYSAPELTRSKLRAMGRAFVSNWRWPVMVVDVAFSLTVVTLIPVLLVSVVLPRRRSP
ncbi:MAG: hypothetical protein OXG46_05845 [Chloroflexi bacterium]|nr:hypothetical protein [Chloroflexota bacterium]MCY3937864.1 hypothetical protein [Chloroflexota bacterium]